LCTILSAGPLAATADAGHEECCARARRATRAADAAGAAIDEGLLIDESSGRDLRHYPPDRLADHLHMRLELRFEDPSQRRFTAVETLRLRPIARALAALRLDAAELKIESVELDGRRVSHFVDDRSLSLRFDPPLPPGVEQEIRIRYTCEQPWDGMIFTPERPEAPHYTAEVHTQGQAESNRHWFVGHDFPNERLTTELVVDVPAGFAVSSNGRLVARRAQDGREVWHWLQDRPHVNYLVSLVIGRFERVPLDHPRVPMHVWVRPGEEPMVAPTYGATGRMLDLLERRFGLPYPWDRYDQVLVKNFDAGGMENTAVTTMYGSALLDEASLRDDDLEGLIAHELAHQWTGDLITCRSWAHIWLNEGWATYAEGLWYEERDGVDGYLEFVRDCFEVADHDRTTGAIPMVSDAYGRADDVFGRAADPYSKGAAVLHMLRRLLGEDAFWSGVQAYMRRHALGLVETADLRLALEESSGLGLEWFFEQWCARPGCPELKVEVAYDAVSGQLALEVEQVQQIDARTPAFRFALPVHVVTASGWRDVEIDVRERRASLRVELAEPPLLVAVDPELHVLKTLDVTQPLGLWLAQARGGPTVAARLAAVEALASHDTPEAVTLLSSIAADRTVRCTLRRAAARSLGALASEPARRRLVELVGTVEEPRVRKALVDGAANLAAAEIVPVLASIAAGDPSPATRAAAIAGLARHEARAQADLIVELVAFDDARGAVTRAALDALADLDDPRGLDLALERARYGTPDRLRGSAVRVVGRLAHHRPDEAVPFLMALLDDPERRAREAAGAALVAARDRRGLGPLRAIASSHRNPHFRRQAEAWARELEEATGGG
jgi:aminopeptidase N